MLEQEPKEGSPSRPREKKELSFFALCRERLRDSVKRIFARTKSDYMILVLDDAAEQLVQGIFSPIQLTLLKFNIIHKLGDRKRNPRRYDALYIIESSEESLKELCKDFSRPKAEMYLDAHVIVLNVLEKEHLRIVESEPNLLKHLRALQEIDIGFQPTLSNAFDLRMKGYFETAKAKSEKWVKNTAERLGAAIVAYHPFNALSICFSKSQRPLAQQLQKYVRERMAILVKSEIKNSEGKTPKIRVLLLDREMDLQSPLMRDYSYLPLVYDVFKVHKNVLTVRKDQTLCLRPEFDTTWEATKLLGIAQANVALAQIAQSIRGYANKRQQGMDKIAELGQKLSVSEQIRLHLDMMEQINTQHGPKLTFLTALEQTVVNGINELGQKLKDSEIYDNICQLFKEEKGVSSINYLRFLCLCLLSLDLKQKQWDSLMKLVKEEEFKDLPKKVNKISPKPKKLNEKPQGEDIQLLFRHQSQVTRHVQMFLKNALPTFEQITVQVEKSRGRDIGTVTLNPKLFVFVQGYIGFNEVTAIGQMQSLEERVICGSHMLVTPTEYLQEVLEIKLQPS